MSTKKERENQELKKKKDLNKAQLLLNKGHSFLAKKDFEQALVHYKQCLIIREGIIARYHFDNAYGYDAMALANNITGNHELACLFYHVWLKIKRQDSGDVNNPGMAQRHQKSLAQMGLSQEEINKQDYNHKVALQHEQHGDFLRDKNKDFSGAMDKYKEAVEAEQECTIGNEISLAYLWRKMLCIAGRSGIANEDMDAVDWNQMDCIDIDWDETTLTGLSETALQAIKSGDKCHSDGRYKEALETYRNALVQRE